MDVGKNARRLPYHEVTALVGGRETRLLASTLDLVWGRGVWAPVRVVVVLGLGTHKPQILVTTDLTLSAREVIECYSLRWNIECSFRDMKVELLGLALGFWSRSVPKPSRFAKRGRQTGSSPSPTPPTGPRSWPPPRRPGATWRARAWRWGS